MIVTNSRDETISLGKKIADACTPGTIIALRGTLGAGKTTLVQGIAVGLGVDEVVTSPTFVIIAEYKGRLPLYHFDLYRLSGEAEFENLGAEDMLYGDGISVIEWSEKIESLLPQNHAVVQINMIGTDTREFIFRGITV